MAKPSAIQPVARTKHNFVCVYGPSGVGKTRLIGDSPVDSGKTNLIVRPPTEHTDSIITPGSVEEWIVRGWNDMNEVEEYLNHEGENHSWVWLDSISLFQDTGLDEIWADLIAAKPHRAQYGLDKGEYGVNMTRLARWCRSMVGIDKFNFGVTAHPFEGVTLDGQTLLMPYVQGKGMANKICGYMNMVAYYEIKEMGTEKDKKMVRVLRTGLTDQYYAKDQFDALTNDGARMVNPTMKKLAAKIDTAKAERMATAKPRRIATKKTKTKRRSR